ncbi:GNAT family N-acetyltransferase [Streptomyces avicenniae]|uniref:GNAT family N-acetyltransferase n=1 Tax=Streptomyces avicenniae TaxID=500153 RepID=UPI00069989F9|nr:GNAT family N-acetyltransferase [Streptomyces avicenniae]
MNGRNVGDAPLVAREFRASDAAPLTAMLHRAYAELGRAGLNFTAVDQDEATTLARAGAGRSWVCVDGGAVVAALTLSLPPGPALRALSHEATLPGRAWLNQLAVDPSRRGQGLASLLWRTGREWARTAGATHVGLDTAAPARHLVARYERWGFRGRETIRWPGKTYASTVMVLPLRDGG